MDKSDPRVTVWHHSAEPCDAKTMILGTDLSIPTSHSFQILMIRVAKTKSLFSFAVTAKLICVFFFVYAISRFSHNEAFGLV